MMPTLALYLDKFKFRYLEPPYTFEEVSNWIDLIIIEGWEVNDLEFWDQYAKNKNFTSYFYLSSENFSPQNLKEKLPEFKLQKYNFHFFLTDKIKNSIEAVRNGVKIKF